MPHAYSKLFEIATGKKLRYQKIWRSGKLFNMGTQETGGRFAPTAIRLRALRRASAYPERQAFAQFLGITLSRLSNFENGFPISREVENRILSKMPWVSGDWLQRGNEAALTGAVLQRLLPLIAEESDTTLPRSRSRVRSGD
jgi:hypothetical protein